MYLAIRSFWSRTQRNIVQEVKRFLNLPKILRQNPLIVITLPAMKKIVLAFCFWLLGLVFAKAQTIYVNGQSLNAIRNVNYITIKAEKAWLATKLSVFLDYGQGTSPREQEVTDANRKPLFFNSKVDIFNLMDRQGWELVDTYEEIKDGKTFILHVFRRKNVPRIK